LLSDVQAIRLGLYRRGKFHRPEDPCTRSIQSLKV
jgi:hypothetical protein